MQEAIAIVDAVTVNTPDLLNLSESEMWQRKAEICQFLYDKGLEYKAWTDERARWWYKSLIFFVEEFIRPDLLIPEFHRQWYWWLVREQRYMNLAPRDHAKTSVHTIFRTVWEICVNRNIRFLIIEATENLARLAVSEIRSHLTQNERIRAGFGIFNPMELPPEQRTVETDWSKDSITVNRPKYWLKDPTVAVAGVMTKSLSRRADRLVGDDIVSDSIAYSPADSARLDRWWPGEVLPTLVSDGQLVIVGTFQKVGDFYHGIMDKSIEKGGLYRVFIGDAIVDDAKHEVLWKERWSWDDLVKQRLLLGSVLFNRNYRLKLVDDTTSIFPMIWFTGGDDAASGVHYKGCFDYRFALGTPNKGLLGRPWLRYAILGVDPAIGTSVDSKFFAAVVLGITFGNEVVVADIVRGKFGFIAQRRLVIDLYEKWRPRYVAVESNAYQKALVEGLEEAHRHIPVVALTSSGHYKGKPDIHIPAMDIWFETARIRIPRASPRSIELTDILVEELHYWGKHSTSDTVMAMWMAFRQALPELERSSIMPEAKDAIYGDRLAYEQALVRGITGGYMPRGVASRIHQMALNAPLAYLSPLRRKGSHRLPLPMDKKEVQL